MAQLVLYAIVFLLIDHYKTDRTELYPCRCLSP
jgi:hypothetical protein